MTREQRRSPRLEISLPVRILVRDQAEDRNLAESYGRINNISRHGLRLVVPQAKIEQWHIFYSFHDNDDQLMLFLEVQPSQADERAPDFMLPVQPIWFDRMLSKSDKPFQLGMEFRQELPRDILEWLNGRLHQDGRHQTSWWSRLLGRR